MYDYADVTKIPVKVSAPSAEVQKLVLQRMDVLQRELRYAQIGLTALRQALTAPAPSSRALADAVMNSRNWLLSVVASYTYIQGMIEADVPVQTALNDASSRSVDTCFRRASSTGYALANNWRRGSRVDIWKQLKTKP